MHSKSSETTKNSLVAAAQAAREQAYAPYSNYKVGAALLAENGKVYHGCNVENASYSMTICAERNAIFQMVADGVQRIEAIAIATDNAGSPCGACRQVMVEFSADIPIYLSDKAGNVTESSLYTILPLHFGPEHLPSNQ